MDHSEAEPHEIGSTLVTDILEAKREIMTKAIDGRIKAVMALPDNEFRARAAKLVVGAGR
jgi:hypothetical protein